MDILIGTSAAPVLNEHRKCEFSTAARGLSVNGPGEDIHVNSPGAAYTGGKA